MGLKQVLESYYNTEYVDNNTHNQAFTLYYIQGIHICFTIAGTRETFQVRSAILVSTISYFDCGHYVFSQVIPLGHVVVTNCSAGTPHKCEFPLKLIFYYLLCERTKLFVVLNIIISELYSGQEVLLRNFQFLFRHSKFSESVIV